MPIGATIRRAAARRLILAGLWAAFAGAAQAEEISGKSELDIEFVGHIKPDCQIAGSTTVNLGEVPQGGASIAAAIPLSCNLPFDLTLRSQNGGLAHTQMPLGQGPYKGALPYRVSLSMPVVEPGRRTVTGAFTSEQLRGGGTLSSGEGIALEGAQMNIDLAAASGAGLLAGEYVEVIELTVQPRT